MRSLQGIQALIHEKVWKGHWDEMSSEKADGLESVIGF